jgi:hypothetical protein
MYIRITDFCVNIASKFKLIIMVSFEKKKNQGYGKAMMVKLSLLAYVLGKLQ